MTVSRSLDLCRVLFFGQRADRTEEHTLRSGDWRLDVSGSSPQPGSAAESRLVAIEVDRTPDLQKQLEARLLDLDQYGFRSCLFLLPNRHSADLVAQMLRERALGPFEVYGVDPEYYHCIVPLTGDNHRQIESFVLDLKPTASVAARIKHWVKQALVSSGRSSRLYEAFVIVLEGQSCS